jgi:saccharopine dehydrogenase (NAD+, L-lysine-forming)
MQKHFLILGGTGATGTKIAELLLQYANVKVTIAARNKARIDKVVKELSKKGNSDIISGISLDASNKDSLLMAFRDVDMVVVASSTVQYVEIIVRAALESNIDYLDIQYSTEKISILKMFDQEISKKNRLFITDAGFHPGLPAALVRYSTQKLPSVQSAFVCSVIRQDWRDLNLSIETKIEFVKEMADYEPFYFEQGRWKKANMISTKGFKKVDFGSQVGIKHCTPMNFEEMNQLPSEIGTLRNTGFYIAGFNWFTDLIIMPIGIIWMKIFNSFGIRTIANRLFRSLEKHSRPPFITILQLESEGIAGDKLEKHSLRLYHEDGYWFTAIPVAACLKQYLDGDLTSIGLHCMGNIVDPIKLVGTIKKLGIKIEEY